MDKPLPSPPVAQIVNPNSPVKISRTLVDAEAGTPSGEQWPAVRPETQKATQEIQGSISDSDPFELETALSPPHEHNGGQSPTDHFSPQSSRADQRPYQSPMQHHDHRLDFQEQLEAITNSPVVNDEDRVAQGPSTPQGPGGYHAISTPDNSAAKSPLMLTFSSQGPIIPARTSSARQRSRALSRDSDEDVFEEFPSYRGDIDNGASTDTIRPTLSSNIIDADGMILKPIYTASGSRMDLRKSPEADALIMGKGNEEFPFGQLPETPTTAKRGHGHKRSRHDVVFNAGKPKLTGQGTRDEHAPPAPAQDDVVPEVPAIPARFSNSASSPGVQNAPTASTRVKPIRGMNSSRNPLSGFRSKSGIRVSSAPNASSSASVEASAVQTQIEKRSASLQSTLHAETPATLISSDVTSSEVTVS